MSHCESNDDIDAHFSVEFVHRLRFTQDVLDDDHQVLADILQPCSGQPARVQFWVDSNVMESQPQMRDKINHFCERHGDRLVRVGSVHIAVGGEEIKNDIHLLEGMLKNFNAAELDRRSYVVVIGGGAVLDAVGFAVAIAHRGLRLVRLPTTTLSQADSGIGVKNSVNLFFKKNWLGTFAVPWATINDASLLSTLSRRDFICGFSEVLKVGLLKDPTLVDLLCSTTARIRQRDMTAVLPVLRRSADLHLAHITRGGDAFEVLEGRPLDFGHWSAHKLEAMSDFELRHGEAVAIGVAIDTVYSSLAHGFPSVDAERVLRCLIDLGFTLDDAAVHDTELLLDGMEEFRQHLGGRLALTMLRAAGRSFNIHEVDNEVMREAFRRVSEYARHNVQDIRSNEL